MREAKLPDFTDLRAEFMRVQARLREKTLIYVVLSSIIKYYDKRICFSVSKNPQKA